MVITANIQLSPFIKIKRTFHTTPSVHGFDVVTDWLWAGDELIASINNMYQNNKKFTGNDLHRCWLALRMDLQCYVNADVPVLYQRAVHRSMALNSIEMTTDDEDKQFYQLLVRIATFYVESRS